MDDIKKKITATGPRPFVLTPTEPETAAIRPESWTRPSKKKRPLRISLVILLSALALLIGGLFLLISKSISIGQHMQFDNSAKRSFLTELRALTSTFLSDDTALLRGEKEGRINILLLGRAGEHYPGKNLTDTVMVMSIDTDHKRVALLSLPRDLYVPLGGGEYSTKLNSVYQYGLSNNTGVTPLLETIETVTDLPIHYFATLDFDSFEKVVDTLGGISVDVPRDLVDTRYPGKNYSYETFRIEKGWQTLDGATALKYVRERHADPEGDFGRAKRQQQVIQAIKNKAFSLGTLFNVSTVSHLLDTLGDSVKTNMTIEDMARFLELSRTLDTKNVTTVVVDAWKPDSLLRVSHLQVGPVAAFILVPRVGNWSEVHDLAATIFNQDQREKRKHLIQAEASTLTLLSKAGNRETAGKIATLIQEEIGFTKVTLVTLPALDKVPEESIMTKRESLDKPYSEDELLKRFSLTKAASLPGSTTSSENSDFTILLGSDLVDSFSLTNTPVDTALDDSTFSEPLPPQPKKKH